MPISAALRKAPFVVTIAGLSLSTACGGESSGGGSGGAAGTGGGTAGTGGGTAGTGGGTAGFGGNSNPPPPECPDSLPTNGNECEVDGTEVCEYGENECCPPEEARCVGGYWEILQVSCNPPGPDPCPAKPPVAGSDCSPSDPCGFSQQTCFYEDCMSSTDIVQAVCDGSTWSIEVTGTCGSMGSE